jgi:hypothetical protein
MKDEGGNKEVSTRARVDRIDHEAGAPSSRPFIELVESPFILHPSAFCLPLGGIIATRNNDHPLG